MAQIERDVREEADQLPRTVPATEHPSPITPQEAFIRGEQRGRALYRQIVAHTDAEVEADAVAAPSR